MGALNLTLRFAQDLRHKVAQLGELAAVLVQFLQTNMQLVEVMGPLNQGVVRGAVFLMQGLHEPALHLVRGAVIPQAPGAGPQDRQRRR